MAKLAQRSRRVLIVERKEMVQEMGMLDMSYRRTGREHKWLQSGRSWHMTGKKTSSPSGFGMVSMTCNNRILEMS